MDGVMMVAVNRFDLFSTIAMSSSGRYELVRFNMLTMSI